MAIHTELPIYKVAYDLLGVVVQLVRNMPREFKQSIGGKIRDECIEIATLVFRANVAADKAPHLLELLERLQVAELLLRLARDQRAAAERVARAEDALADARVVSAVTEADVRQLLAGMAGSLAELPREALKDALRGWLGRVELDPASRAGRITYRLALSRDKVASPRRSGVIPDLLAAGPTFMVARHRTRGAAAIVRQGPA